MHERINLVPKPSPAHRIKKLTPFVCICVAFIGCGAIFLHGNRLDSNNTKLEKQRSNLEQQQAMIQVQSAAVTQLDTAIELLQQQELELMNVVKGLEQIGKTKQRHSEVLMAIAETVPESIRCRQILLQQHGGEITGQATEYNDLPGFVTALGKSPRLASVQLKGVKNDPEETVEILTFTIEFSHSNTN